MKLLSDAIAPDVAAPSTTLWIILGVAVAILAVLGGTAVLIVALVRRSRKKRAQK